MMVCTSRRKAEPLDWYSLIRSRKRVSLTTGKSCAGYVRCVTHDEIADAVG